MWYIVVAAPERKGLNKEAFRSRVIKTASM